MAERAKGFAIVTGAASGMGEAAARLMGEAGWPLILCGIDAKRLQDSARAQGLGSAKFVVGDIAAAGFGAQLTAALGGQPIGALIHCAGLSPTMATPARILEVNLAGTMRLLEAVRPHLSD